MDHERAWADAERTEWVRWEDFSSIAAAVRQGEEWERSGKIVRWFLSNWRPELRWAGHRCGKEYFLDALAVEEAEREQLMFDFTPIAADVRRVDETDDGAGGRIRKTEGMRKKQDGDASQRGGNRARGRRQSVDGVEVAAVVPRAKSIRFPGLPGSKVKKRCRQNAQKERKQTS